jgi:hypothetical protein
MKIEKVLALFAATILVLLMMQAVFHLGYGMGKREGGERMQACEAFTDCMSTKMNDADRFKVCSDLAIKLKKSVEQPKKN